MNKSWWQKLIEAIKNIFAKNVGKVAPQLPPSESPDINSPVISEPSIPEYYAWALGEIGVNESTTPSRIIWYFQKWTKLAAKHWKVTTAWCAAFVSTALGETGYNTLKTSWARDYQNLRKLAVPQIYCIMGFERNGPGGDSHVGFWTGEQTDTHYEILSGNQGNKVCKAWYKKEDLIYCVMPEKVA